MNDKFLNLPVEKDTKIKKTTHVRLCGFDALHQFWSWDGIIAESIIFFSADIENINEAEIIDIVKIRFEVNSTLTFKQSDTGYTFVNFNFRD